jgi:TolB-like protein
MNRNGTFKVGDCLVEQGLDRISGKSEAVTVRPQVMEVLVYLASHADQTIHADELLENLWPDKVVTSASVYNCITELRQAFQECDDGQPYVETIPRKGYRLVAPVSMSDKHKDDSGQNAVRPFVRWLAILAVSISSVAVFLSTYQKEDASDPPTQSIAVLPFVNMSPDPDQEYFSDGLSEEILNLLANIPDLKVIARTSSFVFKGMNEDLRVIGDKLGVGTVLEGSVRTSGDRVRITAQLIDVSDGSELWSESYNRTLSDIFEVQDDVASAIVGALQLHVSSMPSRGRPTDSVEAYALFLKAAAAQSANQLSDVEGLLLRAVELDPNFAEAHEFLASHYEGRYDWMKSREAARRALEINPDLVLARALFETSIDELTYLDYFEAFEQALLSQPNNPEILDNVSMSNLVAGYFDDAADVAARLVAIDPLSVRANENLANALLTAGHRDEALEVLTFVAAIAPDRFYAFMETGYTYLLQGQDDLAIEQLEAGLRSFGLEAGWVRSAVTGARDPETGLMHLERHFADILDNLSGRERNLWQAELNIWYLVFGFVDHYFDINFEGDIYIWDRRDETLFYSLKFRQQGFTAHPRFIEIAEELGLTEIWEKHGPPDFCEKVSGQWVCK